MASIAQARSFLFVPGHQPAPFAKAMASGADAVILDLEDDGAATDKLAAREAIRGSWADILPADRAQGIEALAPLSA